MKASRSIVRRVTWALTGTVGLFVGALVVLAYMIFGRMEDDLVNQVVEHETSRLSMQLDHPQQHVIDGEFVGLGDALRAWLVVPPALPATLPDRLRELSSGPHELEVEGQVWHVRVEPLAEGRLIVLYNATENEQRVNDFGLIIVVLGGFFVLIAYTLSQRLARRVVAPLHTVADRLVLWSPGAMQTEVSREDEAGRVIEIFDRVQQRVDRMMAAQREFTANLSHELRTPLAAMRTDSEMILLDPDLPQTHRTRVARVMTHVDAVVSAMQSARALALEAPSNVTRLAVRACLEDAWLGLSARAEGSGLVLVNHLSPQAVFTVERHAMMTVMRNLIGNAIEHAAPATLTVSMRGQSLYFQDNGPGIAAADLPFVFDRHVSIRRRDTPDAAEPTESRGLGLSIAKRVCDMQGWSLTAHCRRAGRSGVVFVLTLDGSGRIEPV